MKPDLWQPDLATFLRRPSDLDCELSKLFHRNTALTIFDIGACEGEDSIRYSKLYPRSQIYTFEPLPENQSLILENFKRYEVRNARLIPLALSDKSGTAEFHVSSGTPPILTEGENWNYGNKSSSLLPPASTEPMFGWLQFKQRITVPCQKIDEFCREQQIRHIDFIHMDVQGAESLVLQGASSTLHSITAIWMEVSEKQLYREQKLRSEMEEFMKKAGFILVFQKMNEIEGDQFYINSREIRTRAYLTKRKVRDFGKKLQGKLASFGSHM